ncbi:MAG: methylthioribulose 1-phosphate dehydratase [Leptospiraceae bacterium]|nr:methylthioribulose 1-phosphate dehydratase [Leptospiraceae bacterium]
MIKEELTRLITYSKIYYSKGWLPATAGNLSVFDEVTQTVWITASGVDKSNLVEESFISLHLDGTLKEKSTYKPSAETCIHLAVYRSIPKISACIHVHTPSSCFLEFGVSSKNPYGKVLVPNLEILKAFGDFRENPNLQMDVIYNFGDVSKIAQVLETNLQEKFFDMPFVLIQNHGLTVWGGNVWEANKNLEAVDFLLQIISFRKNLV